MALQAVAQAEKRGPCQSVGSGEFHDGRTRDSGDVAGPLGGKPLGLGPVGVEAVRAPAEVLGIDEAVSDQDMGMPRARAASVPAAA